MESYRSVQRNEALMQATVGMKLKTARCGKEARLKRTHAVGFHVYKIFKIGTSKEGDGR